MTIAELTSPLGEPLTLAEAKAWLRVETDDEDGLIGSLIRAVRLHLEAETGLALLTRTFRLYRDDWPDGPVIAMARGPVQTIDALTVYDETGMPAEIDTSGFVLDGMARPARLLVPKGQAAGRSINGIEIDFTAGFGPTAADVPDTLRRAMLLHLALLFEFRGAVPADSQPAGIPQGYDRLIAPFRLRRL